MTGGCSCGVIRYEIASFPLLLYTCNCTNCQTRSGSAFALNMPVTAKDFRILKGEPKARRHMSPRGVAVPCAAKSIAIILDLPCRSAWLTTATPFCGRESSGLIIGGFSTGVPFRGTASAA
jgi:hypothetical protein